MIGWFIAYAIGRSAGRSERYQKPRDLTEEDIIYGRAYVLFFLICFIVALVFGK